MTQITDLLVFIFLKMIEMLLKILPRSTALSIGRIAGRLLYSTGFRKKVVIKNMTHVNLCPPDQMEPLIKKLYCTTSMYAVDFLRRGNIPITRIHDIETVEQILERKKGMIAILAHFGNWELLAQLFGSKFKGLHVIAKKMNNPFTNKWLEQKRTSTKVETIYKEQALRKMIQALAANEIIAILIDQSGGKHGTEALFLGKPANTVKTVAGLVQKSRCPMVSTYALILEDTSYEIIIDEVVAPDTSGLDQEAAIKVYQNQHNAILSSWIRKYPEHYFGWFHKRFKGFLSYSKP
jgi:KDO2-lipid IV(A) lauroyltransferase